MRRRKKIALLLLPLLLLLLSQTPFIYRRHKLGRLRAAVESLNAQRAPAPQDDPYVDYPGVVHVHSQLGGHSRGTFEEIVRAAKENGLSFVVMTEHPSRYVNTSEATLRGTHEDVLFVGGSEFNPSDEDRLLVLPGMSPPASPATTADYVGRAKSEGRLVFVAYPEQFRAWEAGGFDGVEIYNLHTAARRAGRARLFFDGLWSYWGHADLLFSTFYERPHANLRRWDELNSGDARRRLVALAGNDAHQNVGLSLEDTSGRALLRVRLDPYERSFRLFRMHLLLERGRELNEEALLEALAGGRCYVGFDLFGDSTGFRFTAESASGRKLMGDEIALAGGPVKLSVASPLKSRIVFFKDGQVFQEERGATRKELNVNERGVYRVELYLEQLGEPVGRQPWVISNPIYVR